MALQWNKSRDGFVDSKCGNYDIEPLFMGRTRPQAYVLLKYVTGGTRQIVKKYCNTQKEAKKWAELDNEKYYYKRIGAISVTK